MSDVRVVLDHSKIAREVIPTATKGAAKRAAERTRDRVKQNIKAAGRVDTGKMLNSIEVKDAGKSTEVAEFSVESDLPYTKFQEEGIGPVVPRQGKILAFKPKGSQVVVFRPRSKGFKGAHFFKKAAAALSLEDFLP